jgi:polyisoprenoid-binding protein YceI
MTMLSDWAGGWLLDPQRSEITFRSPTMWGLAKVKGTFTEVDGTGRVTAPDVVDGQLRIHAASVRTGIRKRDEHLRSADFFDVTAHPTIDVVIHADGATRAGTVELRAGITIRGIERPVDLRVDVEELTDGALRVVARAEVDRSEFGVDGNLIGMMGDITRVEAAAVFVKQP